MLVCFFILIASSLYAGWRLSSSDIFTYASVAICTFLTIGNLGIMLAIGCGLSKTGLIITLTLLSALIAGGIHYKVSYSRFPVFNSNTVPNRKVEITSYVKFSVVVLIAIALTIIFPTVDHSSADTVHHLGIIKKYMDAETLSFDVFSLSAIYPKDIVYFAYAGNTYNPMIGFVSEALNVEPYIIFQVFTVGSLLFLMLSAYHLTYNIFEKHQNNPLLSLLFLAPVIVALSVFYPHQPSSYVGYPYLPWAGYPSVFALAATCHVLALLVRFSNILTPPRLLIILISSFAAASLHAGFIIGIGAFCLSYIGFRYAWGTFKNIPGTNIKESSLYAFAVIIPLALALGFKFYALSGMEALDAPNISEMNAASWLNRSPDGTTFNLKAIAHKRLPLYMISGILLLIAYLSHRWRKPQFDKPSLSDFWIIWCICLASVTVMYLPVITPFLVDMLSAELMFRIQWIPEVVLPVISLALIFRVLADLDLKSTVLSQRLSITSLLVATGITVWGAGWLINSTLRYMENRDVMFQRNNFVLISDVKSNENFIDFMESMQEDDRYIVTSFSHGAGSHKRIEMTLTDAQLYTPPYTIFDYEKERTKPCTLHLASNKQSLDSMLNACKINYVISWDWPIKETLTASEKLNIETIQNPLSAIGEYQPTHTFKIPSLLPDTVYVQVYDINQLQSQDP